MRAQVEDSQDIEGRADDLVVWVRRWLSALPESPRRALLDEEVAVLKAIIVAWLQGQEPEVDRLGLPTTMRRSRFCD